MRRGVICHTIGAPVVLGGVAGCDDFLATDNAVRLAHLATAQVAEGRVGAFVLGNGHG